MATRILLLVLLATACNNDLCARHSDCSHGKVCSADGVCVGAPDAGTTETPAADAATDADTMDGAP